MATSIFILGYAIGPLFSSGLSELYGRTIIIQAGNILFLIFNLLCGLATDRVQFFIFRFLAGLGGSVSLSVGAGVLSDLFRSEERG